MPLPNDLDKLRSEMQAAVKAHWKAFLFEGILLAILGIAAMIVPTFASLAVTIFLGWMFLISGIGGLIVTFWARNMPGFWWSLFSAVIAIAAGIVLLGWPVSGALSLTLLLIAFFILEGIATIMYALDHKRELSGRWGLLLASGAILSFAADTGS
ncbi:MAG: HdeD family acid-resistance protein, partial [Bradyrhizobium sp.]